MSCGCEDDKGKPFTEYSLVKAGKSVIKHFLDPMYNAFSSPEVKAERIKICESCENIEEFLGKKRCRVCLCFIDAKASLIDQDCPHPEGSKWQNDQE